MKISLRDFLMKVKDIGGDVTRLSYEVEGYSPRGIEEATSSYLKARRENGSAFYTNDRFYSKPREILAVECLGRHGLNRIKTPPRVLIRLSEG